MVGQSGKHVITRRTLAFGTKYGFGVFCLFLNRRITSRLGSLKNDQNTLTFVEKACSLPSFQGRIDRANCKKMRDT